MDARYLTSKRQTLQNVLIRKGISPEARHVIELRLDGAHAAAAKLSAMRNWLNPDGRVRGALKYHGASTGRWTSFGIQLQNLKRPAVENMERAIETVANRRSRSIAPALPAIDVGHRVSRQKIT
jgi:hypothetical protein